MKSLLPFIFFLKVSFLIAQTFPAKFNYQVSIRDANGDAISDRNVSFRIFILENPNAPSSFVYSEEHRNKQTKFGTVSLAIGDGANKNTTIESLSFQTKSYHLRVEIDENNDTNYKELNTTQLISVPYAMAASQISQNGAGKDQVLKWDGNKWAPADDNGGSGSGGGTVTEIKTGQGLTGGTITNTGTISIANTNVNQGKYGSSTQIPVLEISPTGQIISASNTPISSGQGGTVTEIKTGQGLTGGPIINNGTISLANSGVSAGTYGSNSLIPQITVDAFGRVTNLTTSSVSGGGTQYWTKGNESFIYNQADHVVIGSNTPITQYSLKPGISIKGAGSRLIFLGFDNQTPPFGFPDIGIGESNALQAGIRRKRTGSGYEVYGAEKTFIMNHPIYNDSLIRYSCIEGPEAAAYERGTAKLENGRASVKFSDHFGLVINPGTMTINLTPISLESKGLAIISRDATGFEVGELHQGSGNYEFDWEVKAVRKGFENNKVIRHISEYQINTEPSKE
ncbi:MAG: hypothetical protein IPO62_04680 [Saprospiraceae bacterium]|nr:hypothetical protein [Saprospiraceae bacterium]